MNKLFPNLESNTRFFILAGGAGLAFSLACVLSPTLSGRLVDAFTAGPGPSGREALFAFLAVSLAQALLSQLDLYMTETLKLRQKQLMRGRAFRGFARRGAAGQQAVSGFVSFVNNDIPALAEQYFAGAIDIAKCISLLLFSAASLLTVHWLLAVVILTASLLIAAIPKWTGQRDGDARKAYSTQLGRYNTLLGSLLDGLNVLRSCRAENRAAQLLEKENTAAARAESALVKRRLLAYALTGFLQTGKTVLVILTGLWLIARGEAGPGGLVAVLQLSALIGAPMEVLAWLFQARNQVKPLLKDYENWRAVPQPPPAPAHTGFPGLTLENVTCRAGGRPILRGVSAEFLPGGKYLITGESGSGKSTLLSLLTGLTELEYGGSIFLGERPLRDVPQEERFACLCPVFQQPVLFYASLEENILLGRKLDPARYREIIGQLKLGYLLDRCAGQDLTPEMVEKLSGGERQRVALARAMAGQPAAYLLDETTSALDAGNARLVEELLLDSPAAVIHISHKAAPELQSRYDRHFRMVDGKLTEPA